MDRDRRLAEMMGICVNWEPDASVYAYGVCKNCGDRFFNHFAAPDFSLPEWRARLMDWAVEQEWFTKFWHFCYLKLCKEQVIDVFPAWVWRNLPELVYQYDKERKGEGDE